MKILAIGAHPDDIEIGIFGTLAKHHQLGDQIVLCDFTQGEMGSNGTPEIRRQEGLNAAALIQAKRLCLNLPDRGLFLTKEHIDSVVDLIRSERPDWILYPYERDYHPDHEACSKIVKEAIHASGLKHYQTKVKETHRPRKVAQYYINDVEKVTVFIDISDVMDVKIEGLSAHKSQFIASEGTTKTYLNNNFIEKIRIQNAYFGNLSGGCQYAEALHFSKLPLLNALEGCVK